jgi:hypothetical protein
MSYSVMGSAGFGAFTGNPTIGRNKTANAAVTKQWQTFLGIGADGIFGAGTETATKLWQTANGLTPDGVVGPATWAKADAVSTGGTASGGGTTIVIPGMGPVTLPPGVQIPPGATLPAIPGMPPLPGTIPLPGALPPAGAASTSSPIPQASVPPPEPSSSPSWWASQPKSTQYAAMGGGALLLAGALFLLLGGDGKKPAKATPNRRRRAPALTAADKNRLHAYGGSARIVASLGLRGTKTRALNTLYRTLTRRRAPVALRRKVARELEGRSEMYHANAACHRKPPKKYRSKGATARADYADPACYKYPIRFRKKGRVKRALSAKHIRAAASRFGKHKRRYPKTVRKQIAGRIAAAERKYRIGPYRMR